MSPPAAHPHPSATPPAAATRTCDLLVIGSGAGALSAAVTAAHLGLSVIVCEKAEVFGGTTAWSGGWMWVPRNPLALAAGIDEDPAEPRRYLRAILGPRYDAARIEAFLTHAPAMVAFHQAHTALAFVDGNAIPDFHGRVPGARTGGRSVCAAPFDAARLGPVLMRQLRPPRDILSWLGMSIGGDLRHFLRANRAGDSLRYVLGRVLRHGIDLITHGQGRLRMGGNALAAALLASARDAGVDLRVQHEAIGLVEAPAGAGSSPGPVTTTLGAGSSLEPASVRAGDGAPRAIRGARFRTPQGDLTIHARCGVVLACGGFPHDPARKAAQFPHAPTGHEHWSAAPATNTGDGLRLAEAAGARIAGRGPGPQDLADAGAWAPVSLVPQALARSATAVGAASGPATTPSAASSVAVDPHAAQASAAFPHLAERGKPGLIAVDAAGQRFADEAGNYHSLMRGLFARHPQGRAGQPITCWLICDHRFQRRYGLGHSKPWPFPLAPWLMSGYLRRADDLAALARRCGIDPAGFTATVAAYNHHAAQGEDPAFGRGSIPYDRMQGDAEHPGPNPCVAPIVKPPFYALRIVPGSLGTFAGIACDAHGRVLDGQGRALPGLYAAGNDMASVMAGEYPSGGITLGPAMTFGFILAHHAAGQPLAMPGATPPPARP